MLEKTEKLLYKTIVLFLIAAFSIGIWGATFDARIPLRMQSVILILGSIIWGFFLWRVTIYIMESTLVKKHYRLIYFVILIVFLIVEFIWGFTVTNSRPTDLIELHVTARHFVETGVWENLAYFEDYPYQLFTVLWFTLLYEVGGVFTENYRAIGVFCGCIAIVSTAHFLCQSIAVRFSKQASLVALLAVTTCPTLFFYASYYYTDIWGALTVALGLYLIALIEKKSTSHLYFCLGVIFSVGVLFRSTVLFFLIAFCVATIFTKKEEWQKLPYTVISFVAVFLLFHQGIQIYFADLIDFSKPYPTSHFLMMGLDPEHRGRWWRGHFEFTAALDRTSSKAVLAHLHHISEQFQYTPISDYVALFFDKLKQLLSSGNSGAVSFLWSVENYGVLQQLSEGPKKFIFAYLGQIHRLVTLGLCLIAFATTKCWAKNTYSRSLLGFLVLYVGFYLLWESHERYLITILGLLYVIGTIGLLIIINNKLTYKVFPYPTVNILGVLCILFTLAVAIDNKFEITERKSQYKVFSVRQDRGNSFVPVKQAIMQTFETGNAFNRVLIVVKNSSTEHQRYQLVLKNNQSGHSYSQSFTNQKIHKDQLLLSIPNLPKGPYELTINSEKLYSNPIQVQISQKTAHDYYEKGEFIGVESDKRLDLRMRIWREEVRPVMSKFAYWGIVILIITFEVFLFSFFEQRCRLVRSGSRAGLNC